MTLGRVKVSLFVRAGDFGVRVSLGERASVVDVAALAPAREGV